MLEGNADCSESFPLKPTYQFVHFIVVYWYTVYDIQNPPILTKGVACANSLTVA